MNYELLSSYMLSILVLRLKLAVQDALTVFWHPVTLGGMPRTNAAGWGLKRLLEATLNRDITIEQLRDACGVTKGRWYGGVGRANADDFPDAEEARRAAHAFGLSATWLQVELGLITLDDVREALDESPTLDPFRVTTRQRVLQIPNPPADRPRD
jgi:hypothetical protein